jgi:uncharacterized membrane protein (DUF4010 family)
VAGIGVAFICGLLLGIERERRRGDQRQRYHPGVRSFALTAVVGALAQALGGQLVLAGALLVVLLAVAQRRHDRSAPRRGIATELALFLSFLLGVGAIGSPTLVTGIAVVAAITLNLRDFLHRFLRHVLRAGELRDGLLFAAAVLVVRPLLPDAGAPWLLGVNPRALWTLVVIILGIQAAAHIALRIAGPRMGLAASGLASGFISGVATIAAMGPRWRETPGLRTAFLSAALMSNISTFVLLWIVAATIAPGALAVAAPTLACGTLAAVALAAASLARQVRVDYLPDPATPVFRVRQALLFALGLGGASAALAYANAHLGGQAAIAGVAITGFFDVHAAAGSAFALLASGSATAHEVQLSVLLAISCNMISKAAGAGAGGWHYFLQVSSRLTLILAVTWIPFVVHA